MAKQKSLFDKFIQLLTHTVDPIPNNLAKYDVVVLGEVLGGILTHNFTKFTHGHKDIMYISKSKSFEMSNIRPLYEQKRISKLDYFLLPVLTVHASVARPIDPTITKIDPSHSTIEFSNGKKIEYKTLVLEQGLTAAPEKIKGFLEALNDDVCPVISNLESINPKKYFKGFTLFSNGDAFVYIPEFPFAGEIETYNFLMSLDYFKYGEQIGYVSPLHSLTIINANDRFASNSQFLNKFIEERVSMHSKVNVLYNTKLTKIDKDSNKLSYVGKDGLEITKDFTYAYVHTPSKENKLLIDSGLANKSGIQVPVNPITLQHVNYDNIYSYGETADLKLQQSLMGSICQSHVVRHNILQQIENKRPNAEYNNNVALNLFTGMNSLSTYKASSNSAEVISQGGLIEKWNYKQMLRSGVKTFKKIYISKKAGPPKFGYQKFPEGEQVGPVLEKSH